MILINRLSIKGFGFAVGTTGALLYLGCMVVMAVLGEEGTIQFFNTLLHGIDTSSVIRMDVPLWEAGLGLVQYFIIGWLSGACVAALYNLCADWTETTAE